jgi:hypothetical protein
VASDDIPPSPLVFSNRLAISSIVYSIHLIISARETLNQEGNVKKSDIRSISLYGCIAIFTKKFKILKNFFQNLDNPHGRGYYVSMSDTRTNIKRLPEAPVAEWHPVGAKGERDEKRVSEHRRMA